jgi:hypothetical protein
MSLYIHRYLSFSLHSFSSPPPPASPTHHTLPTFGHLIPCFGLLKSVASVLMPPPSCLKYFGYKTVLNARCSHGNSCAHWAVFHQRCRSVFDAFARLRFQIWKAHKPGSSHIGKLDATNRLALFLCAVHWGEEQIWEELYTA